MVENKPTVNRQYKDSLFRIIFREKKELLELYNALNGTNYTEDVDLIVNTLEDAIYVGIKNDKSFVICDKLNLFEHQSSFNPNMGVRGFLYFAELIRGIIQLEEKDILSSTKIDLPFPQYTVFYNGTSKKPERMKIRLSDTFKPKCKGKEPAVECCATMLNINLGHNRELMEKCRKLKEYAIFIDCIRRRQKKGMSLEQAAKEAVDECIKNDVLADILRKNRAEVTNVLLCEYDQEFHVNHEKSISLEKGIRIGERRGKQEGKRIGERRGRREGRQEGSQLAVIKFVCRMLKKGKTPEAISDLLDEDLDKVRKVCEAAREFAPDYDCKKIYNVLYGKSKV